MQCAILAGGLATRMRPLTECVPKALLDVGGRPFADWQLAWLAGQGVTDVVYCVAHLGDQIRAYVGDGRRYGLRVTYADEGPQLAGTAGALVLAAGAGLLDERFIVLYGDSWLSLDVGAAWRVAEASSRVGQAMLMTVYRNEGRFDTSNVVFDGQKVLRYDKSAGGAWPAMDYVDYGMLIVERRLFEPPAVSLEDLPLDLSVVQHRLSVAGLVAGYEATERFYEIGSPEGLASLEAKLASEHSGGPPSG